MKRQTKLVAVASAAALLAIGASMTSFAAAGWTEEGGEWYYYDSDGNRVEDEWKKSGEYWFWLDSENNGAMAIDKLIEDDDNYYYVDSNGAMVRNQWVAVVNEDQDDTTDPAEYRYYYMQSNGKAYKALGSGGITKRTIDGKKYIFDDEGKMLYGWVGDKTTPSPELASSFEDDSTDWEDSLYYLGNWDDGAMKTGWQKINVYGAMLTADGDQEWDNSDQWFYFQNSGKKYMGTDDGSTYGTYLTKTIDGQKYAFNYQGVMIYKWNDVSGTSATSSTASDYAWFRTADEGARMTKGWFKVVPSSKFDAVNNADDEAKWYYADTNANAGAIVTGEIKKINGKYYGFDPEFGYMLSGAVVLEVNTAGVINDVVATEDDIVDTDYMDDLKYGQKLLSNDQTLYYFGDTDDEDVDGAMRTGNTTITVDGTNYQVRFNTSGGTENRGAGFTGIYKDVYYNYGLKVSADSDDKYIFVKVNSDGVAVKQLGSTERAGANPSATDASIKYRTYTAADKILVLGTNGKAKEKANGVKDGAEWYIWTDENGYLIDYANDKDFNDCVEFADNY